MTRRFTAARPDDPAAADDPPQRRMAQRRRVDPFIAMDILAAANAREQAGLPTYHLEVGQPGASLPEPVIEAARARLDQGPAGYTEAGGTAALRQRIARHYAERHALAVAPERILVTTGSSAAFSLAFLLLCEPGDRAALPRPGYPAYRNIVRALGLEPVEIDCTATDGWVLTPDNLARAHEAAPIRCVLVASPNNPTGTVMRADQLAQLTDYCRDAGIWFISDEIYHGLVFEGQEVCALAHDHDAIIINSLSKYHTMTGWRIGWMVVPQRCVRTVEAMAQNLFICPPTLAQAAAVAAFDAVDAFEAIKAGYAANRQQLLALQARLGLEGGPPADGAFYLYWPVERLLGPGETAADLCRELLAQTGVAITPGNDFDPENGHHWVRVSYAGARDVIAAAAGLIEGWAMARLQRTSGSSGS